MTRETKIGLLVGLAFIIVIGILLSDHLTSTLQPPQAPLSVAAVNVREGVASPGVGQVSQERPVQVPEARPNPLVINENPRRESGRAEITILPPSSSGGGSRDAVIPSNDNRSTERVVIPPPQQQDQPVVRTEPPRIPTGLERIRAEHPDELVIVPAEGVREYKAEPGDTISKIARRQLGGDTRANQETILKLNPALKNDPKALRAGETYMIPIAKETTPATVATPPAVIPVGTPVTTPPTTRPVTTVGDNLYTTRSGDTLWRIAINQVGSHAAVEQIKELNRDVLKGSDRLKPGMKLKLPAKSVASSSAQASGSL